MLRAREITLTFFLMWLITNIIKICLRVSKLNRTQGWVYGYCFSQDNFIRKKVRVVSFASDTSTVLFLFPTNYQIITKSMGVMACTRFRLQGR